MLRLLCVGLNTEDDAQTYIKNSIFETLMSFYSSPLSDNGSKELIIQVCLVALTRFLFSHFLLGSEHLSVLHILSKLIGFTLIVLAATTL